MPGTQPTATYRFGPFEADSQTGELRKHGIKLKLQELPFRLLVSLLERPGDVVTREELQAKLWPDGTFVDFERGLGTALNKVRETLCDSAAAPRFIETIPRRGYRFIAQVEQIATALAGTSAPSVRPTRKYAVTAFIIGIVAIVLAGGTAYSRFRTPPRPLTAQDVLVLADFTNTTGDAAFDGALRQALAFELEKSPFVKVMADQDVNQTVQLMGRPAGQRITNDIAHEVCVREGEIATIGGSIANLGKTYQIALQAINCQTGATLAREQALVEDKERVLEAVAKTAMGMRAKLGESLSSIQKPDRHSAFEVTTNSLEALKAYQLGWELMAQDSSRESIGQFLHATELDPNFASAYMFLEIAYRNIGQPARANEALTKAFALIDRIGDRERVYISGRYYQNITHEMNKAIDAYQLVERTYPRFAPPHNSLFVMYGNKGEYEKALAEEQEAFRLEPRNVLFMGNLMRVYIALDRFDEAKAITLKKMMAQKPDQPESHLELLNIAYIQDDHAAQEKEIDWFVGKPNEYLSSIAQAGNAMTRGQRRKAKELYQRAAELARGQGLTDVRFGPPPAVSDALMGDCAAARREKVLPALILCGDASAVRLAEEQSAKNPPQNPDLGPLLYQRGLAGLRAGKNAEAAAEFQKLLDHKGRNWGPRYPLSYLGLARASARVGDTAKANQTYKEFLAQWKDADSDIPILKEARKEYAALK